MADPLSNDLASLRIEKRAPPPVRSRRAVWAGGAVALGAAILGSYAMAPELEAKFFKTEIEITEVQSLSPATVATEVTASGYVIPQLVSKVGTKVQGRIARVHVAEGKVVARGAPLLELDDADQRSVLKAGDARVASTEAEAGRQRAQLLDVKRRLARERALAAEGVTGHAGAENLEAEETVLSESIRAAEANILAAKAELLTLKIGLENLLIRAPIDGTVLAKPPEVGEVVSPVTGPLLEIADFKSLMVEAEVPESRLSKVRIGAPAEIMLEAYPSRRYRGEVKEISPMVNRAKATVVVKVRFVGEAPGVLPNMAARAFFLEGEDSAERIGMPPKTVVPSSALADRDGSPMVFVVEGDRVRMAPVSIGEPFGGGYELERGPRVGTKLVKNPGPHLADGQRVKERSTE